MQGLKVKSLNGGENYKKKKRILCPQSQNWLIPVLRILDAYPWSRILIFIYPDPGSGILCSHKYHTIVNNFIFEQVKAIYLLTQKFAIKLSKYGFGIQDPRSGIQYQKGTGPRIPDPQHCLFLNISSNEFCLDLWRPRGCSPEPHLGDEVSWGPASG
jgi:hypothetical protein